MFFSNGFVYGGQPTESMKVVSVKPLDDMMMIITFSTGESRLFDASILTGEVFRPLKNKSVFFNPVIDHGVVTWNNGEIDCAPEFMYDHSYEYTLVS